MAIRAFFIARQIVETLLKGIRDESLQDYDEDELQYELKMIYEKEYAFEELMTCMEDIDDIEEEKARSAFAVLSKLLSCYTNMG